MYSCIHLPEIVGVAVPRLVGHALIELREMKLLHHLLCGRGIIAKFQAGKQMGSMKIVQGHVEDGCFVRVCCGSGEVEFPAHTLE